MSTTAAASSPDSSPSLRDSFIPTFNGQPAEYKEWRKRITLYHHKMMLSNRKGESILNIVSSLTGTAWRILEDFDVATADKEGTFDSIIKKLDGHFEYDARVQLPQDLDSYFNISRRQGQTLMDFVTMHDEMHRKLQKHGVDLPASVQGWHLLRRCNLTKEQRQLITLRAPQLEKTKVIEALYLVLGQDHRSAPSAPDRRGFGKGYKGRGYVAYDDAYAADAEAAAYDESYEDASEWADEAYWEWEQPEGETDDWQHQDDFDANAAYWQHDAEQDFSEAPNEDVEAYDDAYAAYLDARKRFSDLKLSRGFLPIVALNEAPGNLAPGVLPGPGPSPGGSYKGKKGKKGGSPKGNSPKGGKPGSTYRFTKAPMKPADPKGRAQAALRCVRCGQYGHQAASCPVPSSSKSPNKRPATESVAQMESAHVTFMDSCGHERHDVTMLDPGASAFLSGFGPARRYVNYLASLGYPVQQIQFHRCRHKFHFGGDGESWSHWTMKLPMHVDGRHGFAQVFLLKGETPLLCGRPIIEALGITMDFPNRSAHRFRRRNFNRFQRRKTIRFRRRKVAYLDLDQSLIMIIIAFVLHSPHACRLRCLILSCIST